MHVIYTFVLLNIHKILLLGKIFCVLCVIMYKMENIKSNKRDKMPAENFSSLCELHADDVGVFHTNVYNVCVRVHVIFIHNVMCCSTEFNVYCVVRDDGKLK